MYSYSYSNKLTDREVGTTQWPLTLRIVNVPDKTDVWRAEPNIHDNALYMDRICGAQTAPRNSAYAK